MVSLRSADAADAPSNRHLWRIPTAGGRPHSLTMSFDRHVEVADPEALIRRNIDERTILRWER
jgi:hypothetical protein